MQFYTCLSIAYLLILSWYGNLMRKNSESIITIQIWIMTALGVSLLECIFRLIETLSSESGNAQIDLLLLHYAVLCLDESKRAITRCLLVVVSFGWGVTQETLSEMTRILSLGLLYFVLSVVRGIFGLNVEVDLRDKFHLFVLGGLVLMESVLDFCIFSWVVSGLGKTMEQLEIQKQSDKLLRYRRFRCVLLFVAAVIIASTFLIDEDNHARILAVWQSCYLLLLLTLAVLWQPDPFAKEYVYLMELPAYFEEDQRSDSSRDSDDQNETDHLIPLADTDKVNAQDSDMQWMHEHEVPFS